MVNIVLMETQLFRKRFKCFAFLNKTDTPAF